MLEQMGKVFSCFFWYLENFWYSLGWWVANCFRHFKSKSLSAIKDRYTVAKAQVLLSGKLPREFGISRGTVHGRIFVPFMYKVYINNLLRTLSERCYAIAISSLSWFSPSFADDITLLGVGQIAQHCWYNIIVFAH